MSRRREERSEWWGWALAGLATVAVVGGTLYAVSGDAGPAPAESGYEILPNNAGVKVLDEKKAMVFAANLGSQAVVWTPAAGQAWVVAAASSLGLSAAVLDSWTPEEMGFGYRLLCAYLMGAANSGKVEAARALEAANALRAALLLKQVPEAALPIYGA